MDLTPIPTATKASLPNKPMIQQMNDKTQMPPPTAMLYACLLKKQEAPKQIPLIPNIATNDPKQNNNVLTGIHFTGLPFCATINVDMPSLATA